MYNAKDRLDCTHMRTCIKTYMYCDQGGLNEGWGGGVWLIDSWPPLNLVG